MAEHLFESTEFYKRRYGSFSVYLLLPMLSLFCFILIFSLYGFKEITVQSVGELVPVTQVIKIQSTSNNDILSHNMRNNEVVEKGQILLTYSGIVDDAALATAGQQLSQVDRELTDLATMKIGIHTERQTLALDNEFGYQNTLENYLSQIVLTKREFEKRTTDVTSYNTSIDKSREAIRVESDALNKRLVSKQMTRDKAQQIEQREVLTQEIEQLETAILGLQTRQANLESYQDYPDDLADKLLSLKTEQLANIDNQLVALKSKKQELTQNMVLAKATEKTHQIISPITGVVRLSEASNRKMVPIGTVMADILPVITRQTRLDVTYYVDSTKVSGLKKGMQIRFTSTKELSKPRIITGSIKEVAKSATTERDGNVFLVKASLYPKVKDKRTLIYGMQGRVSSIIDKKTFFNYYKDKLFGSE